MIRTFAEVVKKAEALPPVTVAVAAAADEDVLEAVRNAIEHGIADFLLFGDQEKIEALSKKIGLNIDSSKIGHANTVQEAAQLAVAAVRDGKADVVMKGMIQTADFLRAILNKEKGLRTGRVLSHVATFEVPGYDRLIHVTDPALNVAPALPEKAQIAQNIIAYCHSLENMEPKIAVLGAVEVVNPNMPPTLDAAALAQMNRRGQLKGAVIDGPFALDNAVSVEAAEHKGIVSPVAGKADVLFVPDIEAGNILYKSMVYFAKAKIGALVLGAAAPVVLTSRADSPEAKLYSIALAVLQAANQK
ncbi:MULTISPECIES: phosphate butyryltransferase [Thermoactinomyces]|jgi:phosphate butyryltransferase|uniref:Phosphate butyryltransferase n=1 Tax=Thermoactinomyces daqus TaxID=1329516 RepID=A0A7W2AIJ5_9BACL|nr:MULTISPECIES: phosphate butyryltransferase [Thermoactinomyces]MBA4542953.1 phosphate butyryltransferase [Thermoactinomyces daqus]MBH8596725.1 phosphate butyryltransferase [Thermoactinomyces sp. CICC 10523]MBH8603487.1 phosphate butyryltransferase [Thermoactinomyces sp. CICC 10522]MBH8606651.1 phosphate butyryltransferase [Thermoactinomyces sp. CICC 10521]